jgi:hypothetical protein
MSSRLQFIPEARREFLSAVALYEEARPGLGAEFARAVEQAAGRALAFPRSGEPSVADTRCVGVAGFTFSLSYRSQGDGALLVLAVARPSRWNYWGGVTRRG